MGGYVLDVIRKPRTPKLVLGFEILGSSFSIEGASFSSFGCFVFEIWVLRASVFVFECFVFETTGETCVVLC